MNAIEIFFILVSQVRQHGPDHARVEGGKRVRLPGDVGVVCRVQIALGDVNAAVEVGARERGGDAVVGVLGGGCLVAEEGFVEGPVARSGARWKGALQHAQDIRALQGGGDGDDVAHVPAVLVEAQGDDTTKALTDNGDGGFALKTLFELVADELRRAISGLDGGAGVVNVISGVPVVF